MSNILFIYYISAINIFLISKILAILLIFFRFFFLVNTKNNYISNI